MRFLYTLSLILTASLVSAQVVNTEKMRPSSKELGWFADIDFTLGLMQNKAGQTVSLGSRGRLEHVKSRSRWLLFGSYNLTQFKDVDEPDAVPKTFVNNSFLHLRHNYSLNPLITWETFSQLQLDEVQEVRIRLLNGLGPRFKIVETDSVHLFTGALYMYEYEETTDLPELTYNRAHRLSSYASVGWKTTDFFTVNHVVYFQPDLVNWRDYRLSSETTLTVKITDKLSFNAYFQLVYDSQPPVTVPNTMYALRNGLSIAL